MKKERMIKNGRKEQTNDLGFIQQDNLFYLTEARQGQTKTVAGKSEKLKMKRLQILLFQVLLKREWISTQKDKKLEKIIISNMRTFSSLAEKQKEFIYSPDSTLPCF